MDIGQAEHVLTYLIQLVASAFEFELRFDIIRIDENERQ